MPDLGRYATDPLGKELELSVVGILGSVTIDAQLDAPTPHVIYSVPNGRRAVIVAIIAHSNTANLTGMSDVNFGGGNLATSPVWLDAADLSGMTVANSMLKLEPAAACGTINGSAAVPNDRSLIAQVVAGSTGAANVTLSALGFLV